MMTRSHEQVVTYHRAIITLAELGWAHTAQPMLKVMIEALINCVVVAREDHDFRAFKMMAFEYIKLKQEGIIKEHDLKQIEDIIIPRLPSDKDKRRALVFLKSSKLGLYWYADEFRGPRDVIRKELPTLLDNYNVTCSASHSGQLGYKMFDLDPHREDINPRKDPYAANTIIIMSVRFLLEFNALRNHFENSGQDRKYSDCIKELVSLRPLIESSKEARPLFQ